MKSAVEIEMDSPQNQNHYFAPLERSLRGRFDWSRVGEPQAKTVAWDEAGSEGVPGQRIEYNFDTQTTTVHEPLLTDQYSALRRRVEREGMSIEGNAIDIITGIDPDTMSFWMQRAVDAGYAVVTKGKIPEAVFENVKGVYRVKPTDTDRLTIAIEKLLKKLSGEK